MIALLPATAALRAPLSTPDTRPAVARRDLLAGFAAAVPVLAATESVAQVPVQFEADGQFEADDGSFAFSLPPGWVGTTLPAQERGNPAHLFDIRAKQQAGPGTVLAVCDGGARGRSYGKSVAALGTLDSVANAVVQDELLNDIAAKDAIVLTKEAAGDSYVIKFLVGSKPGIIKLAIAQDRLFYIKVKANKLVKKPLSFFDDASALRFDMEQLADSFVVRQIRPTCLTASNRGEVPAEGVCI